MKISQIRQVAIHGADLDASEDFYKHQLGAKFMARYEPPGLLFFNFEGVRLLIDKAADPATIYFWVDDILAAWEELKSKGIVFEQDPHMIFPDQAGTFGIAGEEEWMAFFRDPGNNMLAIASRRPIGS